MNPWHLPGIESIRARPGGAVAAPDIGAREVQELWCRLDAAADTWRSHPDAARIEWLSRLLSEARDAGPENWQASLVSSTRLSPAGVRAAWDATFAPYDAAALHRLLATERMENALHAGAANLPRRIVHVAAGNVFPATLAMLVRGWLLGAAQWVRPAEREPWFALACAAHCKARAPDLAATFAVSWWPHGDERMEPAILGASDVITIQGDDASIAAIEARAGRIAPRARVLGYGARWSMALVSKAAQTAAAADALATDLALFDQQGCLSPAIVFAEDHAGLEAWCGHVAAGLAARERDLPRGQLDAETRSGLRAWREAMRLGVALGQARGFWESPATSAWAVALLSRCRFAAGPLDRHVTVVPFADAGELRAALTEARPRLQGIGLDLAGWDSERVEQLLAWLHPTRVARLGELQLAPPDWRQDHRAPLRSLLIDA